jgi:hypothetical protein
MLEACVFVWNVRERIDGKGNGKYVFGKYAYTPPRSKKKMWEKRWKKKAGGLKARGVQGGKTPIGCFTGGKLP